MAHIALDCQNSLEDIFRHYTDMNMYSKMYSIKRSSRKCMKTLGWSGTALTLMGMLEHPRTMAGGQGIRV